MYSVSKCTVCAFGCVALNGFQVKSVSRVVCIMSFRILEESVHYLALHQSTSCFKSIQTNTATEETVHCICVSADWKLFFRPTQLYLYESYYKMNNSFFCFVPDIVNCDLKSTLRVLYNLFTRYRHVDWAKTGNISMWSAISSLNDADRQNSIVQ